MQGGALEKTADAQISIWIVYYIQCENARAERLAGGNSLSVKDEVEMGGADLSAVPVLSDAANEPEFLRLDCFTCVRNDGFLHNFMRLPSLRA